MCGAHFWSPVKARLKEKEGKLEKMCIVNPWLGLYIVYYPFCFGLLLLLFYFLSVVWLCHSQLWFILERTTSLT